MEGRKSQGFKWWWGGGRKGGEQLCEKEGLAVSGTKVWKVEGDGMAFGRGCLLWACQTVPIGVAVGS